MATDIRPGTVVIVTNDIIINGSVAFSKGEQVTVEQVTPNPQRPEYRYVIYSVRMGRRYQLRDIDVVVAQSAYTAPAAVSFVPSEVATVTYVKSSRLSDWWYGIDKNKLGIGLGLAVAISVLVVVLIVTLTGGSSGPKKAVETYYEAFVRRDYSVVYDLLASDVKSVLSQSDIVELVNDVSIDDISHLKFIKVDEHGDRATVTVLNTDQNITLYNALVKENDEWKIDISGSATDEDDDDEDESFY